MKCCQLCRAVCAISFSHQPTLGAHDQLVPFLSVTGSDAAAPTDDCKENCTCNNRLVKDMQHLATHIEGPTLPQEVESALSLPVDSLSVTFPVQSVVKVNTQVSIVLHHLHLFSQDGNGVHLCPGPPKQIYNHLLHLGHILQGAGCSQNSPQSDLPVPCTQSAVSTTDTAHRLS